MDTCPKNTTRDFENNTCKGCILGCAVCDEDDHSVCYECSTGLSLFENQCLLTCPVDYLKNEEGTICEPRTDPLKSMFIGFPFTFSVLFLSLIFYASYQLTDESSLFASSLLAVIGPFETFMLGYEVYFYALDNLTDLDMMVFSDVPALLEYA